MTGAQPGTQPPPRPTAANYGYEEATSAAADKAPYVACVSWPRSGHHLLVNLLRLSLGPRFGYCEHYVPSQRPEVPCCGKFPCEKRDVISMSKNHDFDLASPVPTDVKFILQYRHFLGTLVSNFELYVRNENPDDDANFRSFATRTLTSYKEFRQKWVVPAMPNRLSLEYETLTEDPTGSLRRVLDFMGVRGVDEPDIARAVANAPAREGGPGAKGVRVTRDVTSFRYYDKDFFDALAANAGDDDAEPLPIIKAPVGLRRDLTATRPLYVYMPMRRAVSEGMRRSLVNLFNRDKVFLHGQDGDVEDIVARGDADRLRGFDLVAGDFSGTLLPAMVAQRPTVLLAVVRNPIGRVLSLYETLKRAGDPDVQVPLIDALAPGAAFAERVRAAQSRRLFGTDDFDEVERQLASRHLMLASHDKVQAVIDRLKLRAGIARNVSVPRLNVLEAGYQTPLRLPETLTAIRKLVAVDLKLFQRVHAADGLLARMPKRN